MGKFLVSRIDHNIFEGNWGGQLPQKRCPRKEPNRAKQVTKEKIETDDWIMEKIERVSCIT